VNVPKVKFDLVRRVLCGAREVRCQESAHHLTIAKF
jgi:hypothetical protein